MSVLTCPNRELLGEYSLGRLSDEQSDQIAEHISNCDNCQQALQETVEPSDTLVAAIKSPVAPDPFLAEPERNETLALIRAIGREPSFVGQRALPSVELGDIGHYRLLTKLGEGGMGAVYKALHTKLDKVVALKVLPADRLQNPDAVSRFEREMKAVGKLSHPNIVAAHDAGEVDGKHYLVMEMVDGVDLSHLVRRVGPLSAADACELICQAAVGLQHAHQRGMVHRDIKPSNLMLALSDQQLAVSDSAILKILDMGLALLDGGLIAAPRELTSTGQLMGTLDYMAPEQGSDSHQVDIRADIYSLGATLYKLLCGQSPFPSSKYNTAVKMLTALATVTAPSIAEKRDDLPPELVAIVDRMLAKRPDDRFAVPQQVADALAPFAAGADLAALLQNAMAGPTESPADQSGLATRDHITSGSHETSPTDRPVHTIDATLPAILESSSLDPQSELSRGMEVHVRPTAKSRGEGDWWINRRNQIIATAAAFGGLILLAVVTLYFQTNNGTLVVEIDDPEGLIQVSVLGEDILITDKQKEGEPIKLRAGDHKLHVTRGELEFDSDNFTLKRSEKVVLNVKLAAGEVRVVRDEKIIGQREMPSAAEVVIVSDVSDEPRTSPLDKLHREDIDANELQIAGGGDPSKAPTELVAILGDSRLKHWYAVKDAVFADEGKTLITCGVDGAVRTWDAVTGRQVRVFQFPDPIYSLILAPDDETLIVGGLQVPNHFMNATTGEQVRPPTPGHANIALTPDGKSILGGSTDGSGAVDLRDATSGKVLFQLGNHAGPVLDVAIDPQGKVGASASVDKTIKLWNLADGTEIRTLTGHTDIVNAVAFSPNGNLLASASHDGTVRLWDPANGELKHTLASSPPRVSLSVAFSPDGSELAVGKYERGIIELWDVNERTQKQVLQSPDLRETTGIVVFSPDGKTLMSGSYEGRIRFWELGTGKERRQSLGPQAQFTDSTLSPDGTLLATSSKDGWVTIWDLMQRQTPHSIHVCDGHVNCVAFSPDGKTIATGDGYLGESRVSLWDVLTGQQIKELYRHVHIVDAVAFTPDGAAVISGCNYSRLIVTVDVATGEVRSKLENRASTHTRLAVSPDGKVLAASDASRITLWDLTTGKTIRQISHAFASRMAFSPDSKTFASVPAAAKDTTLHVWDVATGEERRTLRGHQGYGVGGLEYAPDGKTLWSSGTDGTVRQWDPDATAGTSTLKRTIQIGPPSTRENLLTVTPDGRHLITANANGTIYVLRVGEPATAHPQVPTESDSDRRAAEWVLSIGSSVRVSGVGPEIKDAANLPKSRFTLTEVYLLTNQNVTDAELERFKGLEGLTKLQLYATKVSDAGLVHLKDLRGLQFLYLNHTKVTDAGLVHLTNLKRLTHLYLGGSRVTEGAVSKLSAALPGCRIEWDGGVIEPTASTDPDRIAAEWVVSVGGLVQVRVGEEIRIFEDVKQLPIEPFEVVGAGFDNSGDFPEAGLANLVPLRHIHSLSLGPNITDEGLAQVGRIQNLQILNLAADSAHPLTAVGLEHISRLPNLSTLQISNEPPFPGAGLHLLERLPKLSRLVLLSSAVADSALEGIKSLQVNSLTVHGNFTDAGLAHLVGMQQLLHLNVSSRQVTDAGMVHVGKLTGLTFLSLSSSTAITDEGLAKLTPLRVLSTLYLVNTQVSDAGVASLQNKPLLSVLDLRGTNITDRSLEHLSTLPSLTGVYLMNTRVSDEGLEHLASLPKLSVLDLSLTKVNPPGVDKLQKLLPNCKITYSNRDRIFSEAVIGMGGSVTVSSAEGSRQISDATRLPTTGRWDTTGIHLDRASVDETELIALHDKMPFQFTDVSDLSLAGTKAGHSFLHYVKLISSLERVDLSDTSIGVPAELQTLPHLAELRLVNTTKLVGAQLAQLQSFPSLEHLAIGGPEVTDAALQHVQGITRLKHLSLVDAPVQGAGLVFLAPLINLKQLDLQCPNLADNGLRHLKSLPKLTRVSVTGTKVTAMGVAELKLALPNCQIESDFTDEQIAAAMEKLKK